MSKEEIVLNYFPLMSDILSHYQYLGILLLGATATILMLSLKYNYQFTLVSSIFTFISAVTYLIVGLFIYRELLLQFNYLMGENGLAKQTLNSVEDLLYIQSWIGFISLLFLLISFILYFMEHRRARK